MTGLLTDLAKENGNLCVFLSNIIERTINRKVCGRIWNLIPCGGHQLNFWLWSKLECINHHVMMYSLKPPVLLRHPICSYVIYLHFGERKHRFTLCPFLHKCVMLLWIPLTGDMFFGVLLMSALIDKRAQVIRWSHSNDMLTRSWKARNLSIGSA